MTAWVLLALAGLLIAANALFVAAEFSLVTVDRATVERQADEGDRRAAGLRSALRRLSTQLSGAQLGITVTSLVVGYLAEPSLGVLLRGPLGLTGLSDGAVTATALTTALLVATGAQMVLGELVPKNWAIAEPLRVGRAVAGFQRGFTRLTGPVIGLLNGSANRILRAMGIEPAEELASARSPAELASLVVRSAERGTLEEGTAELVARSIELGELRAADVMTPRPRVTFVEAHEPVAHVLSAATRTGHARFPVVGEGVDDIVGMVHFKHALAVPPAEREQLRVRDIARDLPGVPGTMELAPLLRVLRESGPQMALVVDEYGGTDGVVSLEDLVEEIVGEIEDEQDPAPGRASEAPGGWSLSGLLRPDEVEGVTSLQLPRPEETDTLGGLVTECLGRLPEVGDTVRVDALDRQHTDEQMVARTVPVLLQVLRMDGRRADRIRMTRLPDSGEAADDE